VQTLSRLNRIHPEKTDTFVLDFRNKPRRSRRPSSPGSARRCDPDGSEPAVGHASRTGRLRRPSG
jgi:hypothetical protein